MIGASDARIREDRGVSPVVRRALRDFSFSETKPKRSSAFTVAGSAAKQQRPTLPTVVH